MRSRRTADEHAPQAPLEKARFNEVVQQYSAYLPVEACHPRRVGGGELCARVHEQRPDTHERFFDTSRLEWLRHVCYSSQLRAIWVFGERDALNTRGGLFAEIFFALHHAAVVPVI